MPTGHPAILPATITPDVTVYLVRPAVKDDPGGIEREVHGRAAGKGRGAQR